MTSQGLTLSILENITKTSALYTVRTITCWFETFINEQCCELLNPISFPLLICGYNIIYNYPKNIHPS